MTGDKRIRQVSGGYILTDERGFERVYTSFKELVDDLAIAFGERIIGDFKT